jgi:nucleoside-diphosphate-sugar epimerase
VNILVTGSSGFVGSALCKTLAEQGLKVTGTLRSMVDKKIEGVDYRIVTDLKGDTNWYEVLAGINVVVHCAARVHIMQDRENNPLEVFREVNVKGTIRLAEQAVEKGIKRFVYISSLKVNGEFTEDHPFKADDIPEPVDPYSISKWEAEQGLKNIATLSGMEIVIIRPPLVYGEGVGANFLRLMQAIKLGLPLPLGAIKNRRSLVGLDNLVSLIVTCLDNKASANQTFLVSDGEDLSTPELLKRTAKAMKKSVCLFPVPVSILLKVASLLGKAGFAHRLCNSLYVDNGKTRDLLGWTPPSSVDESLQKTTQYFLSR